MVVKEKIEEEWDQRKLEKIIYVERQERELTAFVNNCHRDQLAVENEITDIKLEIDARKNEHRELMNSLKQELQGLVRQEEQSRRSQQTMEMYLEELRKLAEPKNRRKVS